MEVQREHSKDDGALLSLVHKVYKLNINRCDLNLKTTTVFS